MEIISNYEEIINFYGRKLTHVEEELEKSIKETEELVLLLQDGWRGRAGDEMTLKLEELIIETKKPQNKIDGIRKDLAALGLAIEAEMKRLEEEAKKKAQLEAAAMEN